MVYSRKYDYYKFPGGGIEPGEALAGTLIRETREEAGLQVIPESIRPYGYVHRVQKGAHEPRFIQDNFYFLCDVQDRPVEQNLDDYEAEAGFALEFVSPEHAIQVNRVHDHGDTDQIMLEREALVLERLMDEGFFGKKP